MSSDLAYRLIVDMSAKGSLAPQLDKMQGQAKGLDTSLDSLRSKAGQTLSGIASGFERLGDKAFDLAMTGAKFGAMGAVAGAAYGIGLNDELERVKTSLASIFKSQDLVGSLPEGLKMASGIMADMRKDAAALPGEFQDLVGFFRLSANSAFQLGVTPAQLEKMSAQAMVAAASNGMQMDMAARELAQLFQGRAGAHNVLGSQLGLSGAAAEKFNHLSGAARAEALGKVLAKQDPTAFLDTFDAQKSSLVDSAKQTLARTTEPVFNSLKIELGRANDWFSKHQDGVERFADKVGFRLQYGFEIARDKIHEWTPPLIAFFTHAEQGVERLWVKLDPFAKFFEGHALKFLEDPKSLDRLGDMAKLYGAVKLGNAAMPSLRSIGSLAESAAGPLGIGGAELAAALGPAALGLAFLAISAEGAMHALTDTDSAFHDFAVKQAQQIEKNLEGPGKLYDSLKKLEVAVQPVTDLMGALLLTNLNIFTTELGWAAKQLAQFAEFPGKTIDYVNALLGRVSDDKPIEVDHAKEFMENVYNPIKEIATASAERADGKTKTVTPPTSHTSIQKVEIVVTSNSDPSRIARLVADHLEDVSRFPRASRHAFTPTAKR